jgi:hypothetical protein
MPRCSAAPAHAADRHSGAPLEVAAIWMCLVCNTDLGPTAKPLADEDPLY